MNINGLLTMCGLGLGLACACTTGLTAEGNRVQLVTSDARVVDPIGGGPCEFLGDVEGDDFWDLPHEPASAKRALRNKAAELGANLVVMDSLSTTNSGSSATGRAFRCKRDPAPPSATPAPMQSAPALVDETTKPKTSSKQKNR